MQEDKFKSWMIKEVPYFDKLSEEEINQLYECYFELKSSQKTLDNIYDLALNHNSAGIDFGNDFSKVMNKINRANRILKEKLDELNSKYLNEKLENKRPLK